MTWILAVLDASWTMLVLAAPYVLFGLIVAGLMHVLLPESLVLRWMGSPGLAGVVRAALIGVPLPVCSCGVVPITVELRRKGASRPAAQSFLITTPESSVDSIFLTWGMMGPVMAIARPIAAFFTAVIGGVLSIASARSVDELSGEAGQAHDDDHHHGHGDPHDHHHHDHGHHHLHHDHEHTVAFAGSARARRALALALGFGGSKRRAKADSSDVESTETEAIDAETTEATTAEDDTPSLWRDLVQPATRYGFGELLDDLAFWLVVGIGLAGVLTAVLPDDLGALGLGSGLFPMLALLVIGIPLYMCASASTPIAAALMLKGVSPGAALVFLLAGPATNAATVLQLAATFGRRFVQIYVVSVAVGAVGAGLLLDAVIGDMDLTESLRSSAEAAPGPLMAGSAMILSVVLVRSLLRGSWAAGVAELEQAGQRMRRFLPAVSWSRRGVVGVALAILLAAYALTGFHAVPPGARGYGFLFGDLARADLAPGLHYLPPAPFGRWETRHVGYPRKSDVGFRTDLYQIERRRELTRRAPSDEWHSPVAAMNTQPLQASYLTGDGSLVEMSFSVHYTLVDPKAFFYGIEHGRDFVNLYAEAVARELIAGLALDELLTSRRIEVEGRVHDQLQDALASRELGIEVVSIRIVDLHPPGAAVRAFRDVSSAKEDRETTIHNARAAQARAVPRSRGAAAKLVAEAEADATRRRHEADGEGRAFLARAEPVDDHPDVLRHLLWIETLERTLSGREKLIVPPDRGPTTSRGITLWQHAEPSFPSFPEDP